MEHPGRSPSCCQTLEKKLELVLNMQTSTQSSQQGALDSIVPIHSKSNRIHGQGERAANVSMMILILRICTAESKDISDADATVDMKVMSMAVVLVKTA